MQAKCVPIFHSVESNQYILILVDPQIRILNYTKKKKWRISSQIPKIDLVDSYIVLWSLKIVLNCYVNEYIGKYEVPLKHTAFMSICIWMSLWQCVCRPELVDDDMCIEIRQGRHPVIQHLIGEGGQYVANDTDLQVSVCNILLYVTPVSLRGVSTCPMIHIWVWVCYISIYFYQ